MDGLIASMEAKYGGGESMDEPSEADFAAAASRVAGRSKGEKTGSTLKKVDGQTPAASERISKRKK